MAQCIHMHVGSTKVIKRNSTFKKLHRDCGKMGAKNCKIMRERQPAPKIAKQKTCDIIILEAVMTDLLNNIYTSEHITMHSSLVHMAILKHSQLATYSSSLNDLMNSCMQPSCNTNINVYLLVSKSLPRLSIPHSKLYLWQFHSTQNNSVIH